MKERGLRDSAIGGARYRSLESSKSGPFDPKLLKGVKVLVVGMGRAGTSVARFLLRAGAKVTGTDEAVGVLASKPVLELKNMGLKITRRPESVAVDWAVVSPGVGSNRPLVQALHRRRIPIVDELDLASRFVSGPLIAITGTNGKSTTTALTARMLANSGKSVFCGGNLAPGQPLSAALLTGPRDYYVVETSSFQLERVRWLKPKIAVILNISADHLNRHVTVRRYADCKLRILDHQGSKDYAVLNRDDPLVYAARTRGEGEKHFFSMRRRHVDARLADGCLWADGSEVFPVHKLRLPGTHNIQNCLAAITTVRLLGLGLAPIRRALRTFRGLPHRLEHVRRLRGVDYVNSSMTTNPAAGARSLEAVALGRRARGEGRVVLIAGGREKALPTAEYVRAMRKHAKWVVLVGESSTRLARELDDSGFRRCEVLPDLKTALLAAQDKARDGDAVLFAPGFASFDQFRDFEARGEAFREEVNNLV